MQRAIEVIREAEASKARIYDVSGKHIIEKQPSSHSMLTDENFMMVASHILMTL